MFEAIGLKDVQMSESSRPEYRYSTEATDGSFQRQNLPHSPPSRHPECPSLETFLELIEFEFGLVYSNFHSHPCLGLVSGGARSGSSAPCHRFLVSTELEITLVSSKGICWHSGRPHYIYYM